MSERANRSRITADTAAVALCVAAILLLGSCAAAGEHLETGRIAAGGSGASCPHRAHRLVSSRPAAKRVLVPRGASRLLLCRYYGLNAGPHNHPDPSRAGRLARSVATTSRSTVRDFLGKFDALRRMRPGTYNCPADDGSQIVALFGYPRGVDSPVTISLSGCRTASNERMPQALWVTRGLLHRLQVRTR